MINPQVTILGGVKVKGAIDIYDVANEATCFNILLSTSFQVAVTFKDIAIQGR